MVKRLKIMAGVMALALVQVHAVQAASVVLSANGNNGNAGPVVVNVGANVQFDVVAQCVDTSSIIVDPAVTPAPKKNEGTSEVAWQIRNQTNRPITINGFGVAWTCINDPNNVCGSWAFDYIKLDKAPINPGITQADKEFRGLAPVKNVFPVKLFSADTANFVANGQEFFTIAAGGTISINEIEFVDAQGKKFKNLKGTGLQVEFVTTWQDNAGNNYQNTFTVTW